MMKHKRRRPYWKSDMCDRKCPALTVNALSMQRKLPTRRPVDDATDALPAAALQAIAQRRYSP